MSLVSKTTKTLTTTGLTQFRIISFQINVILNSLNIFKIHIKEQVFEINMYNSKLLQYRFPQSFRILQIFCSTISAEFSLTFIVHGSNLEHLYYFLELFIFLRTNKNEKSSLRTKTFYF